jgi:hypothetical protein
MQSTAIQKIERYHSKTVLKMIADAWHVEGMRKGNTFFLKRVNVRGGSQCFPDRIPDVISGCDLGAALIPTETERKNKRAAAVCGAQCEFSSVSRILFHRLLLL